MRTFFLLLVTLFTSFSSMANEANSKPTIFSSAPGEWVKQITPNYQRIDLSKSQALPVSYVFFDTQIKAQDSQSEFFLRHIAKANTASGVAEISEIKVKFHPIFETLTFHHINVIRDGNIIEKLDLSAFKIFQQESELGNKLYSETWTAMMVLSDVRPEDSVEFSYTIKGRNPIFGDKQFGSSNFNWSVTLGHRHYRLLMPEDASVNFVAPTTNHNVSPKLANGYQVFQVEEFNTEEVRQEDSVPAWHVQYLPLQYSEYANWNEVVQWALPIYASKQASSPDLDKKFEQLKSSAESKQALVESLIDMVQDDIRYFGIELGVNSHEPSHPGVSFDRRYGDCKDKATLLVDLLRRLDVEAYPALVSAGQQRAIKNGLPSPGAFDHVIVTFFLDGKQYWVDATVTEQAGNIHTMSLPKFDVSLVIKEGEQSLQTIEAAVASQFESDVDIIESFIVNDSDNTVSGDISIVYSGWRADQVRRNWQYSGAELLQRGYLDYYSRQLNQIEHYSPIAVKDDIDANTLTLSFSIHAKQAFKDNPGRREYELYSFLVRDYNMTPEVLARTMPFGLTYPINVSQKSTITLDGDTKVVWQQRNEPIEISNAWFDFSSKVEQKNSTIDLTYNLKVKTEAVNDEQTMAFVEQANEVNTALSYRFWTKSPSPKGAKEKKEAVRTLIKNLMSGKE